MGWNPRRGKASSSILAGRTPAGASDDEKGPSGRLPDGDGEPEGLADGVQLYTLVNISRNTRSTTSTRRLK